MDIKDLLKSVMKRRTFPRSTLGWQTFVLSLYSRRSPPRLRTLCLCGCARGKHTHHLSAMCSVFRIIKGQGIDIKSLSSRSILTVTNMTEDRYGNYTCVASNKLGTANATVSLIRKLSLNLLVANWSAGESECCVLWMVMGSLSSGVSSHMCVFVITIFWLLFWGAFQLCCYRFPARSLEITDGVVLFYFDSLIYHQGGRVCGGWVHCTKTFTIAMAATLVSGAMMTGE